MQPVGAKVKYPVDEVIERVVDFIYRARIGTVKPRLISFRAEYGIGKTRLWELSKENTELANALEQLQTLEEEYVVNGGETGAIPAAFAKFRLQQNPFNYRDNKEVDVNINQKLEDFIK